MKEITDQFFLDNGLPAFSRISPRQLESDIEAVLERNRHFINHTLKNLEHYTWDNFVWPMECLDAELSNLFSIISHLDGVANTPEIHVAYEKILPIITLYHTEIYQDKALFNAYQAIKESPGYANFDAAKKKTVDNPLRSFRLSGIELPDEDQALLKKLTVELSKLESQFEQNVLESTDAWGLWVIHAEKLKGLSLDALQKAHEKAKEKGKTGWFLTLDYPCYYAVMSTVENREIRQKFYEAYVTRASHLFPGGSQWDNSALIDQIMKHRQSIAALLKFKNYATLALETRMLKTPENVIDFLSKLLEKSLNLAKKDLMDLKRFAKEEYELSEIEVWDTTFLSEKMCQKYYAISDEILRQYFSIETVLHGLFRIANQLYDIKIQEMNFVDAWDETVRLFEIKDNNGQLRGKFYLDLYARANKQGGAWVGNCKQKLNDEKMAQYPVAYLNMNIAKPVVGKEARLNHEEVLTLFHEFGHTLHGLLTKVNYPSIAGLEGVAWDGVELPSQLMENWCWEKEALMLMTKHIDTQKTLPENVFENLVKSKNFQAGLYLVRQLEFALFDFNIHLEIGENPENFVQEILDNIRTKTALLPVPSFNRFQHSFTHIFSGGYSAGYYSYLWSEVLSADSFEFFKENHQVFDKTVAKRFLEHILEQGGSRDFMDLFVAFRGKAPTVDALLRQYQL
jgi:oligopeptidase A